MGGAVVVIWDVGACRVVCVCLWVVTVTVTVTESMSGVCGSIWVCIGAVVERPKAQERNRRQGLA